MKKVVSITELNCKVKPIKDIEVGEYVQTNTGLQKVTRKYLPHELPKDGVSYLQLTFDDGHSVKCTNTHKFLMEYGLWVEAGDIEVGEMFADSGRTLVGVVEVEPFDLYDITVENDHCFRLVNNVIAHNSKTIVGGGCFTAGTNVIMADGTLQQIQNIKAGDQVMTYDGAKTVLNTWNKDTLIEPEPTLYTVTFDDGLSVTCSDTHPFMVDTKWVQAQFLTSGTVVDTPDSVGRVVQSVTIGNKVVDDTDLYLITDVEGNKVTLNGSDLVLVNGQHKKVADVVDGDIVTII